MLVREATVEDLDAVFDVYEAVAAEQRFIGAELPLDRARRIESWHSYFETRGSVMFVAEDEGAIVGMADLKARGPAELGMFVAPDRRGEGIAPDARGQRSRRGRSLSRLR